MTTDHTELAPAEKLRAAAAKLRTLLTELGDCRGPWYVVNREQRPYPQRIDNIGVPYVIASTTTDPSHPPHLADYIALMHPRVGYAITQLLESLAARLDDSTSDAAQLLDPHALIAARLILEAPGAPDVTEAADRTEPTLRDRMAAAIYETNMRSPWASAHPDDVLAYGWDADAALRVRDDEMKELRRQAALSDGVTAKTKTLMERRTKTLRERAERAEAAILQALTGLTTDGFARGFRLVQRDGLALDGAVFPSGRCFVLDDGEYGLATVAVSVEELLRGGYHGARIEWAGQQPVAEEAHSAETEWVLETLWRTNGEWRRHWPPRATRQEVEQDHQRSVGQDPQREYRIVRLHTTATVEPPASPAAPEEATR
ncbi:hypothetical protein [Streptomyces rubiginosohelvolus]|uniref:hypothetical protein n=1 Tax=Streptomyces rubiginosohelvolus TaxID=67362 RepID=UPI00386CEA62|nr:hypothetical protein OG475_17750 [Streptomyces rubiginosohelvolus]